MIAKYFPMVPTIQSFWERIRNLCKIQTWCFFLLIFASTTGLPILGSTPEDTEKVEIYFHCKNTDYLQKTTVKKYLEIQQDKLAKENSSLFFLTLDPSSQPEEYSEKAFLFRNGRFLWIRSPSFLSPELLRTKNKQYQFLFHFSPSPYNKWKDYSSTKDIFLVFSEPLPNGFRYLGRTNFLSCPQNSSELGKLSLSFRENRLIRKNFEYVKLRNWRGDL